MDLEREPVSADVDAASPQDVADHAAAACDGGTWSEADPRAARIGERPENSAPLEIPEYFRRTYEWAYIRPRNVALLDTDIAVLSILWGRHRRLKRAAFAEVAPGSRVRQVASVYGDFSPALARATGPEGRLDVIDITPIQVARCAEKLRALPHAEARRGDARVAGAPCDVAMCYFLLHEVTDDDKRRVVDATLAGLAPGGRAVFVDYHRPRPWHPARPVMSRVFDRLEPFAKSMWRNEIRDFATDDAAHSWRKETFFGGLYQKVVAARADADMDANGDADGG